MKAIIESTGKVGSRVRLGGHELVFDQPTTVPGGEDRGPSPLDVMGVSVAPCAHYYAAAFLHGRGLPTAGLSVEVELEKERTPSPRIGRLVHEGSTPARAHGAPARGSRTCDQELSRLGTLLHPPQVELAIEVQGDAVPGPLSA